MKYQGLPWSGYLVKGILKNNNWQTLSGFYITETQSGAGQGGVEAGDVVLKINGEDADEFNLAMQISLAPEEFSVIVWREGEEAEIKVKKTAVQP